MQNKIMTHYLTILVGEIRVMCSQIHWYHTGLPRKIESYVFSGTYDFDGLVGTDASLGIDDSNDETNGSVRWCGPGRDSGFGVKARKEILISKCRLQHQISRVFPRAVFSYDQLSYPWYSCGTIATSRS